MGISKKEIMGQETEKDKDSGKRKGEVKMLYTVEEAARILNLKISRVRMAIFRKEISYVKFGALVRIREIDILNYISKNLILGGAF